MNLTIYTTPVDVIIDRLKISIIHPDAIIKNMVGSVRESYPVVAISYIPRKERGEGATVKEAVFDVLKKLDML